VVVYDFTDPEKRQLHAKIIVADRKKAIVGSANLSWGGMYSNYEIGLLIEGEAAWKLAEIVDTLGIKLKENLQENSVLTDRKRRSISPL